MPDTVRIDFLQQLSTFYLNRGIDNKVYLDSSLIFADQAEQGSKKIQSASCESKSLSCKGCYYLEMGDLKKGLAYFQQVICIANPGVDQRKMAEACINVANSIPPWSPQLLEGRISFFDQARNIYKHLGDTLEETLALKQQADDHLNEGKLDLCEKELLQVIDQLKAIGYTKLHDTYYLLSAANHLKGDQHKELYYCLETVKSMEATNDTSSAFLFYFKLATAYYDLGMYDKSLPYFKKLLVKSRGNLSATNACLLSIIKVFNKEHKNKEALSFFNKNVTLDAPINENEKSNVYQGLASCYIALGQLQQAEVYVKKMINSYTHVFYFVANPTDGYIHEYYTACIFYIYLHKFKEAGVYLHKLMAEPREQVSRLTKGDIELFQFKIDSASGQYISAIEHFEAYKRIADSIYNATKSKQIEELEISYETDQRDKNIELQGKSIQILTKQSQLQQIKFEKRSTVIRFMIVSLILVLLLMGLLYNRYELNKRNNRVLRENQSEISEKNTRLQKLLRENEWLLKEVHHRVKNNLHIVASLMHSQSAYLEDKVALNAIRDSQHRVQTMSLIHQKLYKTENVSSIYMPEYISDLVDYLKDSFGTQLKIYFRLEIEPTFLDVAYVVPLGLILNEAITNAIKYAFPFSDNDTIFIRLFHSGEGEVSLIISDNGRGLPEGFDIDNVKSFGMLLIKGLIEDLNGLFSFEGTHGTTLNMTFNAVL